MRYLLSDSSAPQPVGKERIGALLADLESLSKSTQLDIALIKTCLNKIAEIGYSSEAALIDSFEYDLRRIEPDATIIPLALAKLAAVRALRANATDAATDSCRRGRQIALKNGLEDVASDFCSILGIVSFRRGDYSSALIQFEEAVVASRRAGDLVAEANSLVNIALVLKNTGRLLEARSALLQAKSLARLVQNDTLTGQCDQNLSTVVFRLGQWEEAADLAETAMQTLRQCGLVANSTNCRIALGRAYRAMGNIDRARDLLESALLESEAAANQRSSVLAMEFLGDCEIDSGRLDEARDLYTNALLRARSIGQSNDLVLECSRGLASTEMLRGETHTALLLAQEAVELAGQLGDIYELAQSLLVRGEISAQLGDKAGALTDTSRCRELARQTGARFLEGRALLMHAELTGSSGQLKTARQSLTLAEVMFTEVGAVSWASQARRIAARFLNAKRKGIEPQVGGEQPNTGRLLLPGVSLEKPIVPGFLTRDSRIVRTLVAMKKLATRRLNILIHGESGTGKELIAQAVHTDSRRSGPFVAVNCSAFPGDLIEGELFGHARGAYTGADRERAGLFEHAHNGTLFLDEIGDMPIKAQARLLRALESGEVRRLGENNPRLVDVRIVAATHRDLMTMVGAGDFRLDLYYRLAGYVVELPPLRERREDAKLLIDHYFSKFAGEQGKSLIMTPEVRQQLASHSWPGNVRELRLVVERLVSLSEDGATIATLPFALEGAPSPRSLPELLEAEEKRRILEALQSHNWNKQRAAMTLGTNRTTLIGKMKRMGIASRKP